MIALTLRALGVCFGGPHNTLGAQGFFVEVMPMKRRLVLVANLNHKQKLERPTFDELMKTAEQLALMSFVRAAAVDVRIALEQTVRAACTAFDCWPDYEGNKSKRPDMATMLYRLELANEISDNLRSRLYRAHTIGSAAAHGRVVSMSSFLMQYAWTKDFRDMLRRRFDLQEKIAEADKITGKELDAYSEIFFGRPQPFVDHAGQPFMKSAGEGI